MLNILKSKYFDLCYTNLVNYGVHIGHKFENTSLYSAWMVYGVRQQIVIINLFKFVYMFKVGFNSLEHIIRFFGPIWFINLDSFSDRYVRTPAQDCGEMWVTKFWINGMVSNYASVFNSFRNSFRRSKIAKRGYDRKFDDLFRHWTYSRYSWPRVLFISNITRSYSACREGISLGVPCLGIVDTNTKSNSVSVAIPGNDESMLSIVFYNYLVSAYIMIKKFCAIFVWLNLIRSKSRVMSFVEWFTAKYQDVKDSLKMEISNFYSPSNTQMFVNGVSFFFSKGFWLERVKEKFSVNYPEEESFDFTISSIGEFFTKRQRAFSALSVFRFVVSSLYSYLRPLTISFLARQSSSNKALRRRSRSSLFRRFGIISFGSPFFYYSNRTTKLYLNLRRSLRSYYKVLISNLINTMILFSSLRYIFFFNYPFFRVVPTKKHYFLRKNFNFSLLRFKVFREKNNIDSLFNVEPTILRDTYLHLPYSMRLNRVTYKSKVPFFNAVLTFFLNFGILSPKLKLKSLRFPQMESDLFFSNSEDDFVVVKNQGSRIFNLNVIYRKVSRRFFFNVNGLILKLNLPLRNWIFDLTVSRFWLKFFGVKRKYSYFIDVFVNSLFVFFFKPFYNLYLFRSYIKKLIATQFNSPFVATDNFLYYKFFKFNDGLKFSIFFETKYGVLVSKKIEVSDFEDDEFVSDLVNGNSISIKYDRILLRQFRLNGLWFSFFNVDYECLPRIVFKYFKWLI